MNRLNAYGITRDYMRESLRHSVIITASGILVITFLGTLTGSWGLQEFSIAYVLYYILLSVPIQETVIRGFLQTRLEGLVRPWIAILAASLIFGVIHMPDTLLAALTFSAGLAWGYSFHRKRNLAGPVASHACLGLYLFLFVM
jgi:membrane protease YdiL (CAAX protease family)